MSTNQPISFEERKEECKPLVLVVDDDLTHRKLMELLSERLDITVQCVSCCTEAQSALEMFSFDLILMDIRMPYTDGSDCTRQIRKLPNEKVKDVPIIAVTGCATPEDREKCLKAGMNDYLKKPFTLEEIHEKVCYWLNKRQPN